MRKVEVPAGLRPVIHALLKPRWTLQPKPGKFVAGQREVSSAEQLPPAAQIDYLVSRLQKVPREKLSAPEKKLARWVQILLPVGTKPEKFVAELKTWPCFVEVHVAPPPTPPAPPASTPTA
jgi:hypothetical protein